MWPFCSVEGNYLCNFDSVQYEEHFCEYVKHLRFESRRRCLLKIFPFCSAKRNLLSKFGRGRYEEQFREIILNMDQWFRRKCRLKIFLFLALMAISFSRAEPFVPVW